MNKKRWDKNKDHVTNFVINSCALRYLMDNTEF